MKSSLLLLALASTSFVHGQQANPFAPPRASVHFAPDRTCDLLDVDIEVDVDYPNRSIKGRVVNTMAALRSGITEVLLHAGTTLTIDGVRVDGNPATFRRNGRELTIVTGKLTKGKPIKIEIAYAGKNAQGNSFGAGGRGGWHWIRPVETNPDRMGFWTQGETEFSSEWVPTWDYPNDLATSRTRTTVPANWQVVGNGLLTKTVNNGKTKTYEWTMKQPHATYLLNLVGGPFDIKRDMWEGVQLWYVVPKGMGEYIEGSFGDTKDMLSFFSKTFGVKYPWPKYAQNAMYEFSGGMENVSATTLPESSLTEPRDGFRRMASLNSHELGHQWFGDLVTCKDWGDTWLNESFATLLQLLYFEHSRGKDAYDWEVEGAMRGYFAEARRYKRAISTKMYPNGSAMFDSHAYPKGGAVLHTLRMQLGDEAFYGALKDYLTKWRHTPVESSQLRRAFTESTGVEAEKFWAQWIEKPGHPVLDYSWTYDSGKVKLTVKQLQDTSDGTPVYEIPAKVGISSGSEFKMVPVQLSKTEETFEFPADAKPAAVLLDPGHEFLREIPKLNWSAAELPTILKYSPNAPDRSEAMRLMLLDGSPASLELVAQAIRADKAAQPAFRQVTGLSNLAKTEYRPLWLEQLSHPNIERQTQAVVALGKLPADVETTKRLRALVNPKAPIAVVSVSISALAAWDRTANADVFKSALTIKDRRGRIKRAAEDALKPASPFSG